MNRAVVFWERDVELVARKENSDYSRITSYMFLDEEQKGVYPPNSVFAKM
ncbi:MAG: hypothetical protein GX125_06100 [Bacteroidales bacterium]|jgi:hypothetical protein|nr:hypothetical protein [Bacteroidales bacterium]